MKENIWKNLIYLIVIMIMLFASCTTFKPPTGKWKCDDLNLILDFDYKHTIYGSVSGCGEVKNNNESVQVICQFTPLGRTYIYTQEAYEENPLDPPSYIYFGYFYNRGKNLILAIEKKMENGEEIELKEEEKYIFEKV